MKILLDTHVLLWAIAEPARLSRKARRILLDEETELVLSVASILEIQLKRRARKLRLPEDPGFLPQHLKRLGINSLLPVLPDHAYRVRDLDRSHKDPFDCLLAAQCLSERLPLLSTDPAFARLGVRVVW